MSLTGEYFIEHQFEIVQESWFIVKYIILYFKLEIIWQDIIATF